MQLRRRELRRANELSAHTHTHALCQCVCKLRCQRKTMTTFRETKMNSPVLFFTCTCGRADLVRVLTSVWERRSFLLSSSFTLGRFVFVCLFDMSGGGGNEGRDRGRSSTSASSNALNTPLPFCVEDGILSDTFGQRSDIERQFGVGKCLAVEPVSVERP